MNTILHKLKIAVIFWLYHRKGKTIFLVYTLLCDDLTFNYLELVLMNCI